MPLRFNDDYKPDYPGMFLIDYYRYASVLDTSRIFKALSCIPGKRIALNKSGYYTSAEYADDDEVDEDIWYDFMFGD